jgi:hypothetical protein
MKQLQDPRPQTITIFVKAMGLHSYQVCQARQKLSDTWLVAADRYHMEKVSKP